MCRKSGDHTRRCIEFELVISVFQIKLGEYDRAIQSNKDVIHRWCDAFLTLDGFIGTANVDKHSNMLKVMWFRHCHNWRYPRGWSFSFLKNVEGLQPLKIFFRKFFAWKRECVCEVVLLVEQRGPHEDALGSP
ncbi:hypothetical protein MTO96_027407 [Rhipicephalus appendiculatus]